MSQNPSFIPQYQLEDFQTFVMEEQAKEAQR